MNNHHFFFGALCLVLFWQVMVLAEIPPVDLELLIATAPEEAEYPGADAIVLFQRVSYNIDNEGRLTYRIHQLHKLFTEWSCRNLSDLRVSWEEQQQDLVIHTCRTYMADGKIVDTPDRGFNEVTPDAVARCANFLSHREMVISHVGVERGCILELDYEVRDLEPARLPASGLEFLQGEFPLLVKQVVVNAPESMFLTWHGVNGAPEVPQVSQIENRQVITWTVRDMPALPSEAQESRRGDYLPHVLFSTATDWTSLATQMRSLTLAAITVSPAMLDWLTQTEADSAGEATDLTELDTLQRIAQLLGERIRTIDPPGHRWDRAPRAADILFDSSCGTEWEKAILGLALLQAAGLNTELAFFSRWDTFTQEVATPLSFAHIRLVTPIMGDHYWLSPDASEVIPGRCDLVGKTGLFLEDSPKKFRTYIVPGMENQCNLTVELRPDETDGFQARIDLMLSGLFWLPDRQKSTADVAEKLVVTILQDGEVVTCETLQKTAVKLQLRIEARGSGLMTDDANRNINNQDQGNPDEDRLLTVMLPSPNRNLMSLLPRSFRPTAKLRKTPLYVDQELSEEISLRLTLPENFFVDYLPAGVDLENEYGSYHLQTEQAGRKIQVTRTSRVHAGVIPPTGYTEFYRLVAKTTEPAANHIVLLAE